METQPGFKHQERSGLVNERHMILPTLALDLQAKQKFASNTAKALPYFVQRSNVLTINNEAACAVVAGFIVAGFMYLDGVNDVSHGP